MAINTIKLSTDNNILQGLNSNLVATTNQVRNFGVEGDYVEMNIYDPLDTFLYQVAPFIGYKIPGNFPSVSRDPPGRAEKPLILVPFPLKGSMLFSSSPLQAAHKFLNSLLCPLHCLHPYTIHP